MKWTPANVYVVGTIENSRSLKEATGSAVYNSTQ